MSFAPKGAFLLWCGKKGGDWSRETARARGLLELGFHNQGSDAFSLGRSDFCKFETEGCTPNPPDQGFVDAHGPFLVLKEQGQANSHADLYLGQGCCLTASCGEIEDRRLPFKVIFAKKEETATEVKTAAPTFRHRGFGFRSRSSS